METFADISRLASEELAGIISRFIFTLTMAEEMSALSLKTSAIEVMLSLSIPAKKDRFAFWPSRSISRTFLPLTRDFPSGVKADGRFTYAAFLVDECNDFTQDVFSLQ